MRYLRVTTTPDSEAAPAFFAVLAASPHVAEARLVDWNLASEDGVTALFSVDGDPEAFAASIPETPLLSHVDVTPTSDDHCYLLIVGQPGEAQMAEGVFETLSRSGLVVVKPVVYRDGAVHLRMVGEAAAIRAAVERHPDDIDLEVRELRGAVTTPDAPAAALTDRQRDAVRAALRLGYYDRPSGATHEDIADELGCSSSTASEHLKRAEAKLVRAGMDGI